MWQNFERARLQVLLKLACRKFFVGNPQSLILIPFFPGSLTSDDVVEAVLRGFKRGEEDYGVVARVLLCCIRFSELKHLLDKSFHTWPGEFMLLNVITQGSASVQWGRVEAVCQVQRAGCSRDGHCRCTFLIITENLVWNVTKKLSPKGLKFCFCVWIQI